MSSRIYWRKVPLPVSSCAQSFHTPSFQIVLYLCNLIPEQAESTVAEKARWVAEFARNFYDQFLQCCRCGQEGECCAKNAERIRLDFIIGSSPGAVWDGCKSLSFLVPGSKEQSVLENRWALVLQFCVIARNCCFCSYRDYHSQRLSVG